MNAPGQLHSVETTAFGCSMAAFSACHARLAHLTRTGYADTPLNAISFPKSSVFPGGKLPVTRRWNFLNRTSASSRVFPAMAVVMRDAEAREIAQPAPSKETSWIVSQTIKSQTVRRSPQRGLLPSAGRLAFSIDR